MDGDFGPIYGCTRESFGLQLSSLFGLGPPSCLNGGDVILDIIPPFTTPQDIANEFVLLPNGSIKWIIDDLEFIFYKIGGH